MKLSIRDLDLAGRRVFIRVDFNVPLENGVVTDDTRIRASVQTIRYALERGATAILASHLGRPKGQVNPKYSLKPVAPKVAELLGRPVSFAPDCIGDGAKSVVDEVHRAGGGVVLLENLRFHPEEEKNDAAFARQLASLTDVYVNDAFGAAHRAHASVEAITHVVGKAAAGLLMEKELEYLGRVLTSPDRPLVAILGGAKVSDKLEVIQNFLSRVDRLIIGGAMAYTFLKSRGLPVGRSLVEDEKIDVARDIETKAKARGLQLGLPVDHVVAAKIEARRTERNVGCGRPEDRRSHGSRHRAEDDRSICGLDPRREDSRLERPDGGVRGSRFREGHRSCRRSRGLRERHHHRRRRRFDRRGESGRGRRSHHAHLDRRRRVAGISGRP